MTDALLLARIGSLDENLKRVDESLERLKTWQDDLERSGSSEDRVADALWHKIDMEVRRKFGNERTALDQLRNDLAAGNATQNGRNAWTRYSEVRDDCEQLFDECLEFIGALAFRRTGLDAKRMCQLADALILACALEAYAQSWTFLTVPSLRDVVTKSQLRLSRLRFPDWTVWTLPVIAYVLGLEVMTEQPVAELVDRRRKGWKRKSVKDHHVPVLIADSFAAYLMGPAYGHAAIRLRFDPSRAYQEDGERPTEASRAHVVLETLARMDAHGNEAVWRAQVDELREQWSGAVEAAAPNGRWRDTCESLDELVSDAVEHFGYALNIRAEYSSRAWRRAEVLYDRWRRQAEDSAAEDALTTDPDDAFVTARDVLNAAWLMRIDRPADMGRTEATATAMCRRVLMTREAGGTQGQEPIPTT